MTAHDTLIYTAPWIFPISSDPVKDGAVVVHENIIVEVDSRQDILCRHPHVPIRNGAGILIPPLVNSHIHLELSDLPARQRPVPGTPMVHWIEDLLKRRQESNDISEYCHRQSMQKIIEEQYGSGVVLMADIHNNARDGTLSCSKLPEIYSILELVAPTSDRTLAAIASLSSLSDDQAVSPHSPYSTSAELMKMLKKRAAENNHTFTIHLAESIDEITFIGRQEGPFRDFLQKRKSWEPGMIPAGSYAGSVDYLEKIGVLDEQTLCVHCVHLQQGELELLAARKAKVCLCPGSNAFLGVGRAPLDRMLAHGILPALGTDSLASNDSLDMWREMQIVRQDFPNIKPATVLAMATIAGTRALQKDKYLGSIEAGKRAFFLEILLENQHELNADDILDRLTGAGKPENIRWIIQNEI